MLEMRKIAALLGKQRYAGTTIKLAIKSKIIAVQKITAGVARKINMRYMLRQAKIICECRVWTLHSLLGVLASCY